MVLITVGLNSTISVKTVARSVTVRCGIKLIGFLGKELENCTHQWTTNDNTNTQALSTLSLLQAKEERETTTEGTKKQRRGQTRRRQPN